MLFPVRKIKRYLIYKNVDFARFITIRKIIVTTNNTMNYINLCRTCVNIHRVSSEKWWKQSIQCLPFFYQNLVFQTFENMNFLYLYIYKQPTKYNESDKKLFLIKEFVIKIDSN